MTTSTSDIAYVEKRIDEDPKLTYHYKVMSAMLIAARDYYREVETSKPFHEFDAEDIFQVIKENAA